MQYLDPRLVPALHQLRKALILPWLKRAEVWAPLAFALYLLVGGYVCYHTLRWSNLPRFGWECGNIAESLVRGEGFSGSMVRGSGPTAWMPPLLSWLYAVLFALFGIRTPAAMVAAYLLKTAGMALTLALLLRLLPASQRPRLAAVAFAYAALDGTMILNDIGDIWLQGLAVALALRGLTEVVESGRLSAWGAVAALMLPLVSPVSAFAFVAVLLLLAPRRQAVALALGLCLCSALAWTGRNLAVLGQPFPIKSNFWFDLVEANVLDDDGVVTVSTFFRYHPVNPNRQRLEYLRLGESEFIRYYRAEAAHLPLRQWLTRCLRRLVNASLVLSPSNDVAPALNLGEGDLYLLIQAGHITAPPAYPLWLFCRWDETVTTPLLTGLPLHDPQAALRSRGGARGNYLKRAESWDIWLWGLAHALLVTLSLFMVAARPSLRRLPLARVAAVFYVAFLAPYVLVSHYDRYQMCLTGLQALLVTLAATPRSSDLSGLPG